jgi:hypothetical protein
MTLEGNGPTRRESDSMNGEQKIVTTKPLTSHSDLVKAVRILAPAFVAMSIIFSYLTQVITTHNTDSELGASLPVIVAAYFIVHTSEKRTLD